MAQAYNHLIMPLATSRDKRTQVLWGIRDFEHRFGRRPEGMWLPETAVDLESLDIMAAEGILFTVLAPRQASRVRAIGGEWRDVSGEGIDPKKPYLCRLPSGRTMALFFYDGPISHDLAFGNLLANGELFAKRLVAGFSADAKGPELVHIATDGETYGHHHRFGDMALAYALRYIERERPGGDHRLRRLPGALPARRRGRDRRGLVLELLPRRRALDARLRLLVRRARRLEPGLARPAAEGDGLARRPGRGGLRARPGRLRAGPLGGEGRLHQGHPR